MKKTVAAVAASGLMMFIAGPAGADTPGGQGLDRFTATCDGQSTTITTGGGSSFYVNGQKYHLTEFSGTFDPADGSPDQSFSKSYGNRSGMTGQTITCTGGGSDETGTFSYEATGVAK